MKTLTIPVRVDERLAERTYNAAQRLGSSKSAIVRLALANQLTEIESGVLRLRTVPTAGTRNN